MSLILDYKDKEINEEAEQRLIKCKRSINHGLTH